MTEVPLTTTEISEQVKRRAKPVNQGYSLDAYFAVADSTGVTVRQRAPRPPPFSDPTTTAPGDLEPRPHPAHHIHPLTSHPNSTQAKIYRDEGNQQELFRVLMAFCTLVVETMGKHRDHASDKHKARYRAYLAEVKACMEEMEAIKPGINAEAKVYRERMHAEEPKARPPPVAGAGTAAGVASSITRPHGWNSTSDSQPSTSGTMSNGGTIDDLLSASPEELGRPPPHPSAPSPSTTATTQLCVKVKAKMASTGTDPNRSLPRRQHRRQRRGTRYSGRPYRPSPSHRRTYRKYVT